MNKNPTPLDTILVIAIGVLLTWKGFEWVNSRSNTKKAIGGILLTILLVNVLNWSGYFVGLVNWMAKWENKLYQMIFKVEGKPNGN